MSEETIDADRQWIWEIPELKFCNSYTRLEAVVSLFGTMPTSQWWMVFGEEWSCCDNIRSWVYWLNSKFRQHSRLRLNMMDTKNRAAYDALPDVLTVYRGCYKHNMAGMSWTLDRNMAVNFPSLLRYRSYDGEQPLLLTMTILRNEVVYLNDREEQEIVMAARDRKSRRSDLIVEALTLEPFPATTTEESKTDGLDDKARTTD